MSNAQHLTSTEFQALPRQARPDRTYGVSRCDLHGGMAFKGVASSDLDSCPVCGAGIGTTTRMLRSGFTMLPTDVTLRMAIEGAQRLLKHHERPLPESAQPWTVANRERVLTGATKRLASYQRRLAKIEGVQAAAAAALPDLTPASPGASASGPALLAALNEAHSAPAEAPAAGRHSADTKAAILATYDATRSIARTATQHAVSPGTVRGLVFRRRKAQEAGA